MFCPILYLIWDYWQRNLQHFEPSVTIGFISSALSRQGSYRYVQHFIKASFLVQEAIKWFQNWSEVNWSAVFGLLHKQGQMVKQHIHQARWNCLLRENPQRQDLQQVPRSPFALPHCWVADGILARLDIRMWERDSEEWDEGDFKLHD